jgi:hypothetical protein
MITASLPSDSASWHLKSSAEMLNSFTSRAMVPFESAIPIAMEKARE